MHASDQKRHALVTGATGGLGRHLVRALLAAGWRIRAVGRNKKIGQHLSQSDVSFVCGDLTDRRLVWDVMQDINVVFHCAALTSPWGKQHEFEAANVQVTAALVDAALDVGCRRFVHVSTPSVTFQYKDQFDLREDCSLPSRFVNDYAETKARAEQIVQDAGERGLSAIILRPRGIFGEFDSVLIPRLLSIYRLGRVPVFHRGEALVDVTYAGNVAAAMLQCSQAGAPDGIFNITNGEPMKVGELIEQVFHVLDCKVKLIPMPHWPFHRIAGMWETVARSVDLKAEPRLLQYSLGLLNYSQTFDITSAREQLGYVPDITIKEGLARYASWWKAGAPLWFSSTEQNLPVTP